MSIQRRLYERMAKLDQEKDIQEGPAHQNPLKTAFGGMKDAKNTPSMKAYYDGLKKNPSRPKTAAEREKERLNNRESVELDELKMPAKDAKGNIKSRKVRSAFAKGASKAQAAGDRAMDKATSRGSDIDDTIKHIDRSLDAENRRDDRNRKSRKESVEHVEEAKVGDTVHLGHATKGGSGVKGKVVKIDGRNVHIKNDKGAMFKGPMDRVTVGEAIKYDAAHPDQGITGRVTGKGKRDRGPKGSKTSGQVRTKYSGHPVYKDDSPGLPIPANKIGRILRDAKRAADKRDNTKPPANRNVRNPRLTRDHVEHGVDEGIENMTPAQERDRQHRDNPTRRTVASVRLPSTDDERKRYAKDFRVKRGYGKGVGNKQGKFRDLMLKGRKTSTEEVEVTESEINKKDLRFKRTKITDADERARRDREKQSKTEELLNVAEDMITEAKDSYEVVAVKGSKVVAKMPAEKMDIKDAVAALTKMHGGADVQVHKNGKIVKMKG